MILKILIFSFCFGTKIPDFDGNRAMDLLVQQCDFGPRYPGSTGHNKMKLFFNQFLTNLSDTLYTMDENIAHPYKGHEIILTNYLARFNLNSEYRIMLMAHWDTREIADKDLNINNRQTPILGANDGASGVAVLLTLAEILNQNQLKNIGVDLLFVDGEDMGKSGDIDNFGIGTQLFSKKVPKPIPQFAICLDMVADHDQHFPIEQFSLQQAPEVVYSVWGLANELGYSQFDYNIGKAIVDDHYYLYKHAKIPAIDIIDFDYPNQFENYWHTINDIPENCSSKSLEVVGTVMTHFIYRRDGEFK